MTNKYALTPDQLDAIKQHIFGGQTAPDTSKDLDTLFFHFLTSDAADDNKRRSEVVVSYGIMKNFLAMVDPNYKSGEPLTLKI